MGHCRPVQGAGPSGIPYSKKPWPLGILTIPNEMGLVGQEPTSPKAKWVLGLQDPPNWELCEFLMARSSCFYPMAVFIEIEPLKVTLVRPVPSSW